MLSGLLREETDAAEMLRDEWGVDLLGAREALREAVSRHPADQLSE